MNSWSVLAAAICVLTLAACGTSAEQRGFDEPVVPTSPNAAYQTTFPETVATDVTVLEGPGGELGAEPTPDAAPLVASPVNEEITVSPVTIDVQQQTTATATP